MNKKDISLIADRYQQILNEGLFDRFKKKPQDGSQASPETAPASSPRETTPVDVFGKQKQIDSNSLMNRSETVERIGEDKFNNIELNIYQTEEQDVGSYRDVQIFIPVVVVNRDDYPRPPSIIGAVGKAHTDKQSAIAELQKLGAKYRK